MHRLAIGVRVCTTAVVMQFAVGDLVNESFIVVFHNVRRNLIYFSLRYLKK